MEQCEYGSFMMGQSACPYYHAANAANNKSGICVYLDIYSKECRSLEKNTSKDSHIEEKETT